MTYLGFRVWYADGSVVRGQSDADWLAAPATGVQAVAVYMAETYPIVIQDGWTEQGQPVNQRRVREQYRDFFSGDEFYYLSVAAALWGGAMRASHLPPAVPAAATKTASLMDTAAFQALTHLAYEMRTWSGTEERD